MATEAIAGLGTSFRRWDGINWIHIAEIETITGPTKVRDTIEVVTLDSVDGYRDYLSGLRDGGNVTFTMVFRRDTYDILDTDFESNTLQNYEIFLPDDELTSFEFEGLVTELPLTIPPGNKVTVDVTIKISGQPVTISGSGS